ncbi:MAG: hypothetical protein M1827_001829 [Pycnora praestabilis]|nr:MAG: hypothetical protein M1827_001829 [Pycnora praestabilis]
MEADPSATSVGNDQTVNTDGATVPGQVIGKSDELEGANTGEDIVSGDGVEDMKTEDKQDTKEDIKMEGNEPNVAVKVGDHEELQRAPESKPASHALDQDETNPSVETSESQDKLEDKKAESGAEKDGRGQRYGSSRGGRQWKPGFRKENFGKNVKSDLTSQKESSDPAEIRKQVEFYFSDSNLPLDRFLHEKVGGSHNNPVSIKVIHSFKRMRHFQPYSAVIEALKDSTFLDVTEDEAIRRKVPIDEASYGKSTEEGAKVYEDKAMDRSIYAKGFGEETPSTQFDIEAFFAPHGPTNAIRLRRAFSKLFKGSVFVEFDNEATQKAFMTLEPKPKWKGQDLQWKSKRDYVDEKAKLFAEGKAKPGQNWKGKFPSGEEKDWRTRRDEDQKSGFRGRGRGRGADRGSGRGRGRGNGRGGRDGGSVRNDRNDRDRKSRNEEDKEERGNGVEKDHKGVPIIQIPSSNPVADIMAPAPVSEVPNSSEKKRGREDDDGTDGQGSSKKVDTKMGTS